MLSFSPGYHHMLTHGSINMDKYLLKNSTHANYTLSMIVMEVEAEA